MSRCRVLLVCLAALAAAGACSGPPEQEPTQNAQPERATESTGGDTGEPGTSAASAEDGETRTGQADPGAVRRGDCENAVPIYEGGEARGEVCAEEAAAQGLTVLDLSDDWTPYIFTEDPALGEAGVQPYRPVFLALANEDWEALPDDVEPEHYLELFGIFPTLPVVLSRMMETERHACHAAIDDTHIALLTDELRPWGDHEVKVSRVNRVNWMRGRLERARERLGLDSIAALRDNDDYRRDLERYEDMRIPVDAMREAVQHLRCEELIQDGITDGVLDWHVVGPFIVFQRRHMVTNKGFFDRATQEAFLLDSLQADYETLLRVLRERVVAATGLIEDGSALREWEMVLGRKLDTPEFQMDAGHGPAEGGAPDLIAPATEAAARALGFTSAPGARDALSRLLESEHHDAVAVRLPPVPDYHAEHMNLRAEIDRGDVYYDPPGRGFQPVEQRPIITVYAEHEGREIALVRWATTIGGWKPERTPGGATVMRYKNSPDGPRIWRDVVASPAWLPPGSTPQEDMVRRVRGEGWAPNRALFGPSYRSAYGLVMLMHHRVVPPREEGGETRYLDEGIRVHGSVSYRTIVRGSSHGCHRLYNHLAVRLSSFVLTHRRHQRHGPIEVRYRRRFSYRGSFINFRIQSRGYRFELTPPVDINVLEGNILGRRRSPIGRTQRASARQAADAADD